jgi:hypothetical protein
MRFYILTGPNLIDVRQDYLELTGRPPVPPKKMFGLWLSEYGYRSWEQVEEILASMRANQFPLDGFVLDLFWFGGIEPGEETTQMGSLTWDENAFPDPAEKIAELRQQGIGIILIEEPYIGRALEEHDELEGRGYLVRAQEGGEAAFITTNPWWGLGGMLDFTHPEGTSFWHDWRREPLIDDGILGHWTDLGEPELFNPGAWYYGVETGEGWSHLHPDVHNLYNLLWSRSIYAGYERNERQGRPFILSRSGTSGSQRYGAALWSGDTGSNLSSLAAQFNVQMHMAMSGVDYYGSDIGGFYRRAIEGNPLLAANVNEMYTQWYAYGMLFEVPGRPHVMNLAEIYETAPDRIGHLESNLANTRLRYALHPYVYSLAHRAYCCGEAIFPPLVYYFQEDTLCPHARRRQDDRSVPAGGSGSAARRNGARSVPAGGRMDRLFQRRALRQQRRIHAATAAVRRRPFPPAHIRQRGGDHSADACGRTDPRPDRFARRWDDQGRDDLHGRVRPAEHIHAVRRRRRDDRIPARRSAPDGSLAREHRRRHHHPDRRGAGQLCRRSPAAGDRHPAGGVHGGGHLGGDLERGRSAPGR